ncbi:hypothetical protein E2C01_043828 [Portunus trituberculatus]|uniref:Uncharacterized protein n=1 Tax=Portunus trituberculatus TaxID=210409 RepID=A0A5B7FXS2_PORTR|nr:hypothetical protein [Portunus trituberculatus]
MEPPVISFATSIRKEREARREGDVRWAMGDKKAMEKPKQRGMKCKNWNIIQFDIEGLESSW